MIKKEKSKNIQLMVLIAQFVMKIMKLMNFLAFKRVIINAVEHVQRSMFTTK